MTSLSAVLLVLGLAIVSSGYARPDGAAAPSGTEELPFARDLQRVLDLSVRLTDGTGISAAVVVPGRGTWTGAAGSSEPGEPVSPDMSFNIASVGKNFVAILVCQLAREGRLSLDDPLSRWLPDYANVDRAITIRQLLNHTSGIFDWVDHPRSPFRQPFNTIPFDEASSPEAVVTTLVGEPYFPPGRGFHYSTTNYTLLRMTVEAATGSTVAAEIRRRFLEPLALTHTVVLDVETRVPGTLRTAHAWCDVDGEGALEDVTSRPITWVATRSPALVYSSAEDLAQWSQALYGGRVLDRTSLAEVLTFHRPTPDAPGGPFATGYGLGTQEFRLGGLVLWGHLGWQYGYTSSMLYVPRHSSSIIVLINDNNMMLINLAAMALCVVTQFHLETFRFTVLLGSTLLLLSTFVLWPLDHVARLRGRRCAGPAATTDSGRRRGSTARWAAVVAASAIASAAAFYVGHSLDPATPLRWAGGTGLARAFIGLSIGGTCVAISLVLLAISAWKDRWWSLPWRVHYALVALAALITASALSSLLF